VPRPSRFNLRRLLGASLLVSAALFWNTAALRAEGTGKDDQPPDYSDKTHEALKPLQDFITAKNYDGAIALLQGLIPDVAADSPDRLLIENTLGRLFIQGKEDPKGALSHFDRVEAILRLHPNYWDNKAKVELLQLLAGVNYQIGATLKAKDEAAKAEQRQYYDRAIGYLRRWLDQTPKLTSDMQLFYAEMLFYKATANPEKPDLAVLREARKATEKGLSLDIHPKDTFYQLLAVECIQENDYPSAAEYLEVLTTMKPTNKDYWTQLMVTYNTISDNLSTDAKKQRGAIAREINVIERAQRMGFLKSTKENYVLVSLYSQVGQYGKATELLAHGLRTGGIENKVENWLYLDSFYLQVGENLQAIAALKEAEKIFPGSGDIDRAIADVYYQDYNTQEVYNWCKRAIEKGHLKMQKPYSTYQLFGYAAFELQKYEEALEAVNRALKMPGAPKKELTNFKDGIENAIKARDAQKAAVNGTSL
jgi:tetratricopeptide (TPR) repeat protein